MRHHIIVKYNSLVTDKQALIAPIAALFEETTAIPGVHAVTLCPSVIDRPNRYDLMIVMEMDAEALPIYDASEPHQRWKEQYSHLLEQKAIFDCE